MTDECVCDSDDIAAATTFGRVEDSRQRTMPVIGGDGGPFPEYDSAALFSAGSESKPGGRFTEGTLGTEFQLRYMLYEPASRPPGPAPLLVLLHGCQQSAEDFAAGTRMNVAAEAAGVIVLYPEQSAVANAMRCWNWYALQDRVNDEGDAAVITAMTRQVMCQHDIDPTRVYVAGMSAGGAMAVVAAREYPELYAALGVHSGVPAGLAQDLYSAMRLMSSGPSEQENEAPPCGCGGHRTVASIVFHGDEDAMVHPSNGEAIHAAIGSAQQRIRSAELLCFTKQAEAGHRGFTRSVELGPGGLTYRELWMVHGAGHAWAGGSVEHQYTDPSGPDASREMMRFLLQHRLPVHATGVPVTQAGKQCDRNGMVRNAGNGLDLSHQK